MSETSGKTIFIVDDSELVLMSTRKILVDDYRVLPINSAQTLMQLLKTSTVPDMILLDVEMPVMSGADILPIIKATPGWENVPVILLTAWNQDAVLEHFFQLGAMDVIHKPIIPCVMATRIKNYMELAKLKNRQAMFSN